MSLVKCMVVKKVKLLTRLKQAKGNESEQINWERLHDSETLKKQAGKTQCTQRWQNWTGCGCSKAFAKYTFLHVGLATKSIVSFTCQAGLIGEFLENFGRGGLQRARRLGRKSLFSALNSSRALAALAPKFSANSPIEPVSNLLWWCLWFLCGLAHHGYVHTIMPDSSYDLRRYKSHIK